MGLHVVRPERSQRRRVGKREREVRVHEVVLVDSPEDVERVEAGDRIVERALHAGGQKRKDRGLHVRVAGELVHAKLLLACGLAEGERRRRNRQLVPDRLGQPRWLLSGQRLQAARRFLHRELGGDDARRLVMGVRRRARILRVGAERHARGQHRDQQRDPDRGPGLWNLWQRWRISIGVRRHPQSNGPEQAGDLVTDQLALRDKRLCGLVDRLLVDVHQPPAVDVGAAEKLRHDAASVAVVQDRALPGALLVHARRDLGDRDQLLTDLDGALRHLGRKIVGTHADGADHPAGDRCRTHQVAKYTTRVLTVEDVFACQRAHRVADLRRELRPKVKPLLLGRQ